MQDVKPLVRVKGLRKYFHSQQGWFNKTPPVKAVDGVSFDIYPGETYGLVGESGCGKSTLGRSVLRLFDITDGDIEFAGQNIGHMSDKQLKPLRRRMQAIFQDPYSSLNPGMTVAQIIAEPMKIHGYGKEQRAARTLELLEKVGLKAEHLNRFPHEFSGGQRQRISIARALSVNPEFVLCDEPLSALDVSVQAQVLELLEQVRERTGVGVLFITHDLRVAAQICDTIMVMQRGKVVETGSAETVLTEPRHEYTRALIDAAPGRDWDFRNFRPIAAGLLPAAAPAP